MKLLYKPLGILFSLIAGFISRRLFKALWSALDEQEPPTATTEHTTWSKVIVATALRALTFSVTRAAADRLGAKVFAHLTGFWPGKKTPKTS